MRELSMIDVPDDLEDMLCLLGGEFFQFGQQFPGLLGSDGVAVEKLLGGDAEIFTYVEKSCKGREGPFVFDLVDVAFALAQGQTHVPGGNTLLQPKLCHPVVKPLDLVHAATSFVHI